MEIAEAQQVEFGELEKVPLDAIIVASGYEKRARNVAQLLGTVGGSRLAIGFRDRPVLSRAQNDRVFKRLGYTLNTAEASNNEAMKTLLMEVIGGGSPVRILIDYTSMTRVWYAAAIELLRDLPEDGRRVEVFFTYSPSTFSPPLEATPNVDIGPLPGFCHLQLPTTKTALVVGLGYEANRAAGLVDYVEAAETYAFMADPALDKRFVTFVERNNSELLKRLGSDHVIRHPFADLRATEAALTSLCLGLAKEFRVILAPLGPKPFTMISLLFAAKFPFVDVWRVSAGERAAVYDRAALGSPLTLRIRFGV